MLDRYVARLVSLKRTRDALALYRREIDRNPSDPGLYDTMAAFLEQNDMGAEIEAVYKRAIAQFQDHTWEHKLARWYLRQKRQADVARLTRDVVRVFSGTELDEYFREIVSPAQPVGPALSLQLNLFAHQRFPHYLAFARNLLTAYSSGTTMDMAAYEAILRRHWYDADDLRMRFFERLSRTGRLDAELSVVRTSNPAAYAGKWDDAMNQSPVAVRLLAEGEAWRGHYENAAPLFMAMESSYPPIGLWARAPPPSIVRWERSTLNSPTRPSAWRRKARASRPQGSPDAYRHRRDRSGARRVRQSTHSVGSHPRN